MSPQVTFFNHDSGIAGISCRKGEINHIINQQTDNKASFGVRGIPWVPDVTVEGKALSRVGV